MNKIDIFNANAEFFERFNNSLEDTANDRHGRTRFTVTGLENKVEFAVTNAQGRIKKAEDDAVDRLNQVNGMTNDELISKSVGAGKWMREGAYGLGGTTIRLTDDDFIGHLGGGGNYTNIRSFRAPEVGFEIRNFYTRNDRLEFRRYRAAEGGWQPSYSLYTEANTGIDSNGVLHNTKTPINTLNTSDMADTVVDNDLLTVTSGAVYRVIQELRAEISLLKGKLNE